MLMPVSPNTGEGPVGNVIHGFGPGGAVTYPAPGQRPQQHPILGQLAELLAHHGALAKPVPGNNGYGYHPGNGLFQPYTGPPVGSSPIQMLTGPNGQVPAPDLPPGTYTGAYAAQGLRSTDPAAAAQLWESRHPAQVSGGNVPGWVQDAMGNRLDVHSTLSDAVNHSRAQGGLPPMHPEELHGRVAKLAKEIVNSRGSRRSGFRARLRGPVHFPEQQLAPSPSQTYTAN